MDICEDERMIMTLTFDIVTPKTIGVIYSIWVIILSGLAAEG
jgi:hypothetical protein